MAFVCTAGGDNLHVDFFRRGDAYIVLVPIGYDDTENVNYFVVVGLEPTNVGALEYFFHIVRVDGETGEETPYWSGAQTASTITGDDRTEVLNAVLNATAALISQVKPELVFRCTRDEYPPEEALEKHFAISQVFINLGYTVTKADPYLGKHCWWMERDPEKAEGNA